MTCCSLWCTKPIRCRSTFNSNVSHRLEQITLKLMSMPQEMIMHAPMQRQT